MPFTSETAANAGKKSSRKGVSNKSTATVRQYFQELLTDNLEQLREDITLLTPENRIRVLLELARYVVPRLNTVHYVEEAPQQESIDFSQLNKEELHFLGGILKKQGLLDVG